MLFMAFLLRYGDLTECTMAWAVWGFSCQWLILGLEVSCLCGFTRGALRKPLAHHKLTSQGKVTSICCYPALAQARLSHCWGSTEWTDWADGLLWALLGVGFIPQSPVWMDGSRASRTAFWRELVTFLSSQSAGWSSGGGWVATAVKFLADFTSCYVTIH